MSVQSAVMLASAVLGYGLVLLIERWSPLRRVTQRKVPRVIRNITLGAIGSAVLRLGFYPYLLWLCGMAAERQWGLTSLIQNSDWLRMATGFLLLDYSLYIWHWLNHKVGFLWRFHNSHHVDLDLDISTGSRFHFGELILSVGPRALEIVLFGITPATMVLYDTVVMAAVHFHHSNMRLPERLDRLLSTAVVTPRMHGIHHSIVRPETDSNFSTVLSVWDRLHRSLNLTVPQSEIVIGVPSYRNPKELTLIGVLLLPFRRQRDWRLPDGTVPTRRST